MFLHAYCSFKEKRNSISRRWLHPKGERKDRPLFKNDIFVKLIAWTFYNSFVSRYLCITKGCEVILSCVQLHCMFLEVITDLSV